MAKNCGWCDQPSLQATCVHCTRDIYICHNSVDCSWTHRDSDKRKGGFYCWNTNHTQASPIPETIEPSETDDISKPVDVKQYPALVLATSKRAGKQYADMLGLDNYKVVMTQRETQGLKTRAIVITPGYYDRLEETRYQAGKLMFVAMQTGRLTNAPIG